MSGLQPVLVLVKLFFFVQALIVLASIKPWAYLVSPGYRKSVRETLQGLPQGARNRRMIGGAILILASVPAALILAVAILGMLDIDLPDFLGF